MTRQEHRDIAALRFGQTDTDMTLNGRTIAKGLTVYSMSVKTIDACQDKYREIVPQQRRMLKICLFGNDTLMSMLLKF